MWCKICRADRETMMARASVKDDKINLVPGGRWTILLFAWTLKEATSTMMILWWYYFIFKIIILFFLSASITVHLFTVRCLYYVNMCLIYEVLTFSVPCYCNISHHDLIFLYLRLFCQAFFQFVFFVCVLLPSLLWCCWFGQQSVTRKPIANAK